MTKTTDLTHGSASPARPSLGCGRGAVSGEAVNKRLFNTDTVDQMLKVLMTKGHRVADVDDFVWVVVTHLTERGVMDVEPLYEPPFTDHAPHGPEDLFSGADVGALVDALAAVRATAGPAEGVA